MQISYSYLCLCILKQLVGFCVLKNYKFSLIKTFIISKSWRKKTLPKFGAAAMNSECILFEWLLINNVETFYDVNTLWFLLPFRSLSCQRITLHKNLFFSFVCNSIVTIIHLTAVANNQALVATNPVSKMWLFPHVQGVCREEMGEVAHPDICIHV